MKDNLNNIDALSGNQDAKKGNNVVKFIKDWAIPLLIAVIIGICINKFLIYNITVPTASMHPTIKVDDRLMVTKVYNPQKLQYGDIVVFKSDELNKMLIKRLIGKPGDKIEIKDGIVYRNGEKLEEDYVKNNEEYNRTFDVPEGKYFFLGDNRKISDDARYWKNPYIDAGSIDGKARIKYYPISDFEIIK